MSFLTISTMHVFILSFEKLLKLPQVVTQPSDQHLRNNLTGRLLVGRNSLTPDHFLICHKSSGSVAGFSVRRLRNVPRERGRVLLVSAVLLISLSQL